MKYITICCLFIVLNSHAQEPGQENQQKRPSWSQGLPERQATVTPGSRRFTPEPETTTSTARNTPEAKNERLMAPKIEIDLATAPVIDLNVRPETTSEKNIQPSAPSNRSDALANYFQDNQSTEQTINPLIKDYSWNVIKTTPIDIPINVKSDNTLKLNIQINPKGQVTRVTSADSSLSSTVIKYAESSIRNWRFQPPKEIGITENISKTFTIEIKTS